MNNGGYHGTGLGMGRGFIGATANFPGIGRGRGIGAQLQPPGVPSHNFSEHMNSPISAASFGELRNISEKLGVISDQLAEVLQVMKSNKSDSE